MSHILWKYFFNDDVDNFRQFLAKANFERNASKGLGGAHAHSLKVGSPGNLATSPRTPTPVKGKKSGKHVLTRSDLNAKDGFGRTLLHHAVSSRNENAFDFVKALLEIPLVDLYAQDTESGWTALHRALYSGNIAAAQALMIKDLQNATDYTTNVSHANAGGLIKIKDHEGNSPFEVFGLTTAPRDLQQDQKMLEAAEIASLPSVDMDDRTTAHQKEALPMIDLHGDEVFAFGSNKNITLGLGDGDDRTFPERVHLNRPDHLMQFLFEDFQRQRRQEVIIEELTYSISDLHEIPAVVRNAPIVVQDVVMSKLHTAILTQDPISNLHICGFGPGGRLGTGDEATRFNYTCVQGGGLAKRRVVSIALGQDHSVAVCSSGEVFTWGSNKYGQLGYELPEVSVQDTPMQLTPRQIYGLIKKEQVIGAAASSLHSAIYTSTGLYTFGKNEGQLGLMDADARSLEMQIIPRRIGVSIIQHGVQSVTAIDRATIVLLDNHDVIVFTHFGWTKVVFPLDSFGSSIASEAFFIRHQRQTKHVFRVTAGSNTICALTTYGEVFTVDVPRHVETISSKSTTNPTKARNALPTPSKVWSIRKSHMAANDVAVGQDGSIILCTASGTVWKKEKRANIKSARAGTAKSKDYKFVRVPNILGAVAVRSNCFGAFTAIRKDCDVMREQIVIGPVTLWNNVFALLAFCKYGELTDEETTEEPQLRFWKPATKGPCPALIKRALLMNANAEDDFIHLTKTFQPLGASDYDVWVSSNVTDVRLPVHSLVLKARSKVLRKALAEFADSYYFSIPDCVSLEYGSDGQIQLQLQGADFLTLVNFVLYLYADTLVDVWRFTAKALHLAPRYRAVRTELMKIATALEMRHLERAVRVMDEPVRCLREDFESGFHDSDLFSDADVVVDLADGEERYAHSVILQARCPFFEGLFGGHTGGMWTADRRNAGDEAPEAVRVDLKHISSDAFELVLRHIYADTGEELFDTIVTADMDEFVDLVIDVMAVANELMLERLARVCQKIIGRYVNPWNICGLLNTIAESSETEFKSAGLEYIGLNLEHMLEHRLLEELDEYLLEELSEAVQSNQLAFMPIARSDRVLESLLEQDPTLAERIAQSRQRRLDSMRLPSRYVVEAIRPSSSRLESRSAAQLGTTSGKQTVMSSTSPLESPNIAAADDLQFEMDEETGSRSASKISPDPSPRLDGRTSLSKLPLSPLGQAQLSYPGQTDDLNLAASPLGGSVPATPPTSGMRSGQRPAWTLTPTMPGLGFKDIMLQDSSQKVSNLTQSLNQAASATTQSQTKLSQKERKRQQHEHKVQAQAQMPISIENKAKEKIRTAAPQSPWQKVEPKPTAANPSVATNHSRPSLPESKSTTTSTARQGSEAKKEKPAQASRSISTPGMTGASNAPPPQIQSIRHTPAPARSASWLDARTSMADILAQQHYEKTAIQDSAAARSLQDIQQEQEFQEWWENESKRIQEETAAANTSTSRRGKSGRGSRKTVGGRGGARAKLSEPPTPSQGDADAATNPGLAQRGRHKMRGGIAGARRGASQQTIAK